jgi:uncharacterized protein
MSKISAEEIIDCLDLLPLPVEGGYFRVTYTADENIQAEALPERYTQAHSMAGAIYFLATEAQFSAMHRLATDELYYYHLGDPLEMLFLYADGRGETKVLGPDMVSGQQLQIMAPRQCWHGSRPLPGQTHGFSLLSTSMAPAYDKADVVFARREDLINEYPDFSQLIIALTRVS